MRLNSLLREDLELQKLLGGADANPRRGSAYVQIARAFIDRFPPGSHLTTQELDTFLLEWVPDYRQKDRALWAERLRKSGTNGPLIRATGHSDFTIHSDHKGGWNVLTSRSAMEQSGVLNDLKSFLDAKARELGYLAEGVDMSQLPTALAQYLMLALEHKVQTLRSQLRNTEESIKQVGQVMERMKQLLNRPELGPAGDLDLGK